MTNELTQAITEHVSPQVGLWFTSIIWWIGLSRFFLKPVSSWLLRFMTKLVDSNPAFARRLVQSTTYKLVAFLADYSSSVKLPTEDSLVLKTVTSVSKENGVSPLETASTITPVNNSTK